MKNLLLLITLITLSCNPPEEPAVTYYNHDSKDGQILKIVSTQEGIISQEFKDAEWEVERTDMTVSQSDYEKLCNLVK